MDQCVVNLNEKSCTCNRWELTGIPCKHAVAAIWYSKQGGTPEMWTLPVYWLDTWRAMYRKKLEPINGRKMWPKSACPTTLLAPKHHVQVGRPKTKRIKARDEATELTAKQRTNLSRKFLTVTCSKCHNKGHNSRTCKGQGGPSGASQTAKCKKKSDKGTKSDKGISGKRKRSKSGNTDAGGSSAAAQGTGGGVAAQGSGGGAAAQGSGGGAGGQGSGGGAAAQGSGGGATGGEAGCANI